MGPSSINSDFLKFSRNKVDLLRINMSHVNVNILEKLIKKIRKNTKVPICLDTEGAQIRTKVKNSKIIKLNSKFFIHKRNGNFKIYPEDIFSKIKVKDKISIGFDNLIGKVTKV